jgi:hypothetical protein
MICRSRSVLGRLLWLVTLVLSTLVGTVPRTAHASGGRAVLAQYYAWFDANSWGAGKTPDQPQTPYISADRGTIDRQVTQAQQAGIDAFELDWWGPGNPTDSNLQTLLSVASSRGFKVALVLDLNSPFIHNSGDLVNTLRYATRYFGDGAWFHYGGKPFIAFYGNRKYDVGTWASVRSQVDPSHAATWIGEGDLFSYLDVFDGIYPYSIAWSPDPAGQLASYAASARSHPGKLWVATVMPGYNDTRLGRSNGFAVDRQGGAYYSKVWQGAMATQPDLVSISTWNEWPEGSQVEPSQSYGNLYLQLTRQFADAYRTNAPSAVLAKSSSNAAFFTQTAQGHGGFWITDDANGTFYSSFQALGGVSTLGYPSSQRFVKDGFTYQATQGALMQWRPELGEAILANSFEWFTTAGLDDWLNSTAGIPRPIRDDGSSGNWDVAKQTRLAWLTDDAIRADYASVGSVDAAIERFGLPMSKPEQHGPFVIQRFQRVALQHWVESVAGMPPIGSVVRVLAGDLLKQSGLVPASAAQPSST